jgi:hypothetical protein
MVPVERIIKKEEEEREEERGEKEGKRERERKRKGEERRREVACIVMYKSITSFQQLNHVKYTRACLI